MAVANNVGVAIEDSRQVDYIVVWGVDESANVVGSGDGLLGDLFKAFALPMVEINVRFGEEEEVAIAFFIEVDGIV